MLTAKGSYFCFYTAKAVHELMRSICEWAWTNARTIIIQIYLSRILTNRIPECYYQDITNANVCIIFLEERANVCIIRE